MAMSVPLKAVVINCSLKPEPGASHTGSLLQAVENIMGKNAVDVVHIHAAARQIAFGIYPDMTEHGAKIDDWPDIWTQIDAADTLCRLFCSEVARPKRFELLTPRFVVWCSIQLS
jgi:multimeric flavodoxin WrbA|tara:strand:- start:818 stop:1162 length:345 start_codon:yes stop_codon:yes gene_type:complete